MYTTFHKNVPKSCFLSALQKRYQRLKRWELIVTAMLFLTLFAGFGLLYVEIPLGITFFYRLHHSQDRHLVVSQITENNYV